MSQTNFAKKLGIKRQAVNFAITKGRIVKHGSGRQAYIDLDCPLTKEYMNSSSGNRYRGKIASATHDPAKPQGKPDASAPPKKEKEIAPASPENVASVKAYHDKQEIERRKKIQETKKIELHNAKTRGELVDREVIQAYVHETHEIDNGQWKTLGLKISTDIAAVFGIDDDELIRRACDVVDKEVYNILKQVKRMQNAFLKKIGAEKIPKEV
jgi:hypothetical protein